MRTTLSMLSKTLCLAAVCLTWTSCSQDDFEQDVTPTGRQTIAMNFEGSVVGFDQSSPAKVKGTPTTGAGSNASWTNGDKIFITFYNGSSIIPGEATYNSSSGWSVSYDGSLASGTNQKCEARYFVNATFANSSLVTLNTNTEIYEDVNATYSYSNGALTVQASMTPKTGRIRFTGTPNSKIYTTGITSYSTFAPSINQFTTTEAMAPLTVGSNGSTPYLYGYFPDSERKLSIIGSDFAFTRQCDVDVLKTGDSGYMSIPSESSHNNWRSGMYIKAAGVEFKMIPVAGLSSGFYLIGETEVTEQLYNAVNEKLSTSQLPISNIYYSDVTSWIEKLSNLKKLNFALPTADEWKYAAKGGKNSQGYTYSGSNIPGDVAWYSANTTTKQIVKLKTPNELGIYDMSGNVSEWVLPSSNYRSYTYWGGSFSSSTSDLGITNPNDYNGDSAYTRGFRLKLTCE